MAVQLFASVSAALTVALVVFLVVVTYNNVVALHHNVSRVLHCDGGKQFHNLSSDELIAENLESEKG